MPHATLTRFGYPQSLIREYAHWAALVRPTQVTAGSMVIVARSDEARRWPGLPVEAFTELATVTSEVETALGTAVGFDKINYLMLMMSDPHVHFHVLPRHATPRSPCGIEITDASWPTAPDLSKGTPLDDDQIQRLAQLLTSSLPASAER